jgi:hypothetical protein
MNSSLAITTALPENPFEDVKASEAENDEVAGNGIDGEKVLVSEKADEGVNGNDTSSEADVSGTMDRSKARVMSNGMVGLTAVAAKSLVSLKRFD